MELMRRLLGNFINLNVTEIMLFILLMNFGFMGWGTRLFSSSNAIVWLLSILLPLPVFYSAYVYSTFSKQFSPISHLLRNSVYLKVLLFCVSFLSLGILQFHNGSLRLELTGDEIAYARNAQGPGIVFLESFADIDLLQQTNPIYVLRIINGCFYLLSILSFVIMLRIQNRTRRFLYFAIITIVIRFLISLVSEVRSPNPPMFSYFLGLFLTVMPTGDFWVRIVMLICSTIAIVIVLYKISAVFGKSISMLVFTTILSNFAISKTFSIIEPAVIGFLVILYLVSVAAEGSFKQISNNLILCLALLSFFRVSILAFALFLSAIKVYEVCRNTSARSLFCPWNQPLAIFFFCVTVGLSFIPQRITQYTGVGNLADLQTSLKERNRYNLELLDVTRYLFGNLGPWQLSMLSVFLILLVVRTRENWLVLLLFVLSITQFSLASRPSSVYASKYVLEFIAPFTFYVFLRLKLANYGLKRLLVFQMILCTFASCLLQTKFLDNTQQIEVKHLSSSSKLEDIVYRYSIRPQFKVQELYAKAKSISVSDCLEVGINYGIWHQIYSGYTLKEISKQIELNRILKERMLNNGDRFGRTSIQSLMETNTRCLILQPSEMQQAIMNHYLGLRWRIIKKTVDEESGLTTVLMTKEGIGKIRLELKV